MKIIGLGANSLSAAGGYSVDNSLRFNDDSSDNLSGTLSSGSGSDVKGTISLWVKRSNLGTNQAIICGKKGNTERVTIGFTTDDYFEIQFQNNSNAYYWRSSARYRDTSAWYNCIIKLDTGNGTATSRARVWINNEEITSWGTQETCPQNLKIGFFNGSDGNTRLIGARGGSSVDKYFDGYICEVVGINNSLSDNTDFGEVDEDSGIWKPIDVSGLSFGTNGFYLDFENSGSLGADVSGNGNNFTVNNLTSIDQSTDTCTNNFATLNFLSKSSYVDFSNGNLVSFGSTSGDNGNYKTNMYPSSGKWYVEVKCGTVSASNNPRYGLIHEDVAGLLFNGGTYSIGTYAQSVSYQNNGGVYSNSSLLMTLSTYTTNDIISLAVDFDNGAFYVGKNGTWLNSGDPTSGASKTGAIYTFTANTIFVLAGSSYNSSTSQWNFGSPTFSISSGNTDGNGYGNFEYAVPSSYYSLCTKNLAEYG